MTTERHLYSVRYRRIDNPNRVFRLTVVASDADEARAYARVRDVAFGSTVSSPKRRGVVPEQADGLTAAKGREFVEWRGTSVEVVDP